MELVPAFHDLRVSDGLDLAVILGIQELEIAEGCRRRRAAVYDVLPELRLALDDELLELGIVLECVGPEIVSSDQGRELCPLRSPLRPGDNNLVVYLNQVMNRDVVRSLLAERTPGVINIDVFTLKRPTVADLPTVQMRDHKIMLRVSQLSIDPADLDAGFLGPSLGNHRL